MEKTTLQNLPEEHTGALSEPRNLFLLLKQEFTLKLGFEKIQRDHDAPKGLAAQRKEILRVVVINTLYP